MCPVLCAFCVMSCQLISEMHEADVVDGVEEGGCSVLLCMTGQRFLLLFITSKTNSAVFISSTLQIFFLIFLLIPSMFEKDYLGLVLVLVEIDE